MTFISSIYRLSPKVQANTSIQTTIRTIMEPAYCTAMVAYTIRTVSSATWLNANTYKNLRSKKGKNIGKGENMRVNSRVFTEKTDLLGEIQIPNCPSQFKSVAEKLMMMATKPGYSVSDYNNVTQLDKILMVDYWQEYDNLQEWITPPPKEPIKYFSDCFVKLATPPDLIARATRWLVEHNYLFLKPEVQERAIQASNKWRQAVSHQ